MIIIKLIYILNLKILKIINLGIVNIIYIYYEEDVYEKIIKFVCFTYSCFTIFVNCAFTYDNINYDDVNYGISDKDSVREISKLNLNASREYTLSRGFQIIDGNIHDRCENLTIPLDEHGFTLDGTTISADFSIIYRTDQSSDYELEDVIDARNIAVFDGTMNLAQNTSGNQGRQLGSDFSLTSANPSIHFRYVSGQVPGVDFALINTTTNQTVNWFADVRTGLIGVRHNNAFNPSRPSDTFRVLASGAGGAGNASLDESFFFIFKMRKREKSVPALVGYGLKVHSL